MRVKMANAVELGVLHGTDVVNNALAIATAAGRFDEGDLASIIQHHNGATAAESHAESHQHETKSLAQGTGVWQKVGA
jgi:hypothetical protein